ncbi:hypothetical protein [Mesorhizobium sp.]|uniref:hypothetical protein n=1 Tax=Mesorhizobium sp. TaxID=1871066 RepID=UPI000FE57892|nr:hypothetical protein [Mesorhizobium sp.]RWP64866.1 MAG: hypothetical protein EOR08_08100 [Mesorhizobium sp.]RWQ56518.1 MAG: hypothetical protein EOS82_03210 [Mesorhizobium sp.]
MSALTNETPAETARQVAWLIERKDASLFQQPHWYHEQPDGWHSWRPAAHEAKRFSTKAEAEADPAYQMIASDPTISVTEHVFLPVSAPEKGSPLDETWKYRIPESLADLIPLFENRVACHRLWAEWLDQDTDETRRYSEHGIGPAKAHWDYVKQYSAAKRLVEDHESAIATPVTVTDAMVDAAAKAMHDGPLGTDDEAEYTSDEWNRPAEWCRDMARAALTAALSPLPAPGAGEPADRADVLEEMVRSYSQVISSKQRRINALEAMVAVSEAQAAPATQAVPDMVRPVCRVMTMQHSSGAPDHYVSIEVGDRQITPHMFKTKGRAEYEVAEWIWLLNGGEKPSILDFDTDPQPLTTQVSHPSMEGGAK